MPVSTIPGKVMRGKHDKDQRRQCLIEAGTDVFAEYGFDAATTREVAERAGCSEGLIHRYFGSKRGLLLAILEHKAEHVIASSDEAMPERATLAEEIEQMLISPFEMYWEQRNFMRVSVSQAAIDKDVGHVIGDHINGNKVKFFAARLRRHQDRGEILADVDIDAVALALSGLNISCGFFAQVAFEVDRDELRQSVRAMGDVIARGLTPDPVRDPRRATKRHEGTNESVVAVDDAPVIIARAGRRAPAAARRRQRDASANEPAAARRRPRDASANARAAERES